MAVTFTVTGPGTPNLSFSITVVGSAISVQIATDNTGTATNTIHDVYNALAADGAVTALVALSGLEPDPSELFNGLVATSPVAPALVVIILGEVICFTLTASTVSVPAGQLAFYGVRRISGSGMPSDPAPSTYPFYQKQFQIPVSFNVTAAYNPALPLLSQSQRVQVAISDYDFVLRHIVKYCVDGNGAALTVASPFAVLLYDSVYRARMNYPLLAELLMDDTGVTQGRNFFPSPPIMYAVNRSITFDIFTLLDSTVILPVTVNLLLDGYRRIPCN